MNAMGVLCCVAFFVIVACQAVLLHWYYYRHSNWRWLNRRYPAAEIEPAGKRHTFSQVTIRVNQHWYCRVSQVVLNPAGMQIAMRSPLLELFHHPLLIPWDDVTLHDQTADGSVVLDVGDATKLTLTGDAALATLQIVERLAQPVTTWRAHHRAAANRTRRYQAP